MKSKISLILMIALLFSCNIDYSKQSNVEFESLNEIQAKELAQNEVANIASSQTAKVWNSNSKVVSAFPVYLDGIDGISYYECKVVTDDKDSGYVLVNINNTDFPIVEACETGVTLNESYANSTGLEVGSFDVYRYGYFESVAYASEEDGASLSSANGKKERKVVGSNGLDINNFDFDSFKKAVKENNGSPYSTVSYEKESKLAARGMTGKGDAFVEIATGAFKGKVSIWDDNIKTYRKISGVFTATPAWDQFLINGLTYAFHGTNYSGFTPYPYRAIGCGPIAWGIVLAYWQVKHIKTALFSNDTINALVSRDIDDYNDPNNRAIYKDIISIDNVLETSRAAGQGYTPVHKMKNIEKYINSKGYSCSIVHDNGGYDSKFNMIYDALAENKPVVMGIHSDGIGAIDHYVVIEGAKRQSVKRDSYIRYFCNMGSGCFKYVYAYNDKAIVSPEGAFEAARHSTYSFWVLTIY